MADSRRRTPREFDWVFANREWVSRIERDADVRPRLLRDGHELLASEILVVFDGQRQARVGSVRRLPAQRCAGVLDHLLPSRTAFRPPPFEHGGEVKADERSPECRRAPDRLGQRLGTLLRQPEAADRRHACQLSAKPTEVCVGERRQPPPVQLDTLRANLPGKIDEA